jgi:hypothetical protein
MLGAMQDWLWTRSERSATRGLWDWLYIDNSLYLGIDSYLLVGWGAELERGDK